MNVIKELLWDRNVLLLHRFFWPTEPNPTPLQLEIIKAIVFPENLRVAINAMTRYGKSQNAAKAFLIFLALNPNTRNVVIAPTRVQAEVIRQYLTHFILLSPSLSELVMLDSMGLDRLKKESTKDRQTFKNGSEYRVFSAEGEANRILGWGATGIVLIDEAVLIGRSAWAKISRMLGDAPKSTILVELSNPWLRDSVYYDDWTSGKFLTIHIDWQTAVAEGRTTREFVEEQRQRLTALEFQVLYESRFPDQSEDALFNYEKVIAAVNRDMVFEKVDFTVLGADIADKGKDSTVIYHAYVWQDFYNVQMPFSESKSENTAVAGRLLRMRDEINADMINIDTIGVGVGVVSMVKEGLSVSRVKVNACHFGEKANDSKRFLNKKAEMYFRLNDMINNGKIHIPNHPMLLKDLLAMRWEYSSNGRIRIVDPDDKSPDFSDALVYTIWNTTNQKGKYLIG